MAFPARAQQSARPGVRTLHSGPLPGSPAARSGPGGIVTEPAAVQQDLDDLLGRLQVLGIRIRELRVSLAPLEAELETARREFDERVGSLRREGLWLEHQVHLLKTPARPAAEELTA